ncbi:MAG: hypothetical protein DWH82_10495 [Planctomycetota bacterium]|nr:MAG: hypothetical protein DWH82_10495 [Planctomycetota bacterium]
MEKVGIRWPVGHGVGLEDLSAMGAIDGSTPVMGLEIKPLLLLLDSTGQVLWTDGHARHQHQPPAETVARLEAALLRALP